MRTHTYLNGIKIAYEVTGPAEAPALIMLHGSGSGGEIWRPVIQRLAEAEHHRIFALDQRGFGDSDRPGAYGFELMRDDVIAFADDQKLSSISIVGHSMGGTIAWLTAQRLGPRVTHLVAVDSPPPKRGPLRIDPGTRPEGDLPFDWEARVAAINDFNNAKQEWWDDTKSITAKTLIVAGGPQSHVPQGILHEAAALVKDVTLIEIPVGHGVHVDAPDEFAAALKRFLVPS